MDPGLSPEPPTRFAPGDRVLVRLTGPQADHLCPAPVVSAYLKLGTVHGVTVDTPRPWYWVRFDDGTEHKLLSGTQLEPAAGIVGSN